MSDPKPTINTNAALLKKIMNATGPENTTPYTAYSTKTPNKRNSLLPNSPNTYSPVEELELNHFQPKEKPDYPQGALRPIMPYSPLPWGAPGKLPSNKSRRSKRSKRKITRKRR